MKAIKMEGAAAGRTMLQDGGKPVLVKINARPARSAPEGTRLKCVLYAEVPGGVCAMPFAGRAGAQGGRGGTPEWRLEMN